MAGMSSRWNQFGRTAAWRHGCFVEFENFGKETGPMCMEPGQERCR